VTPALAGGDVGPASAAATGETQTAEKQEAGRRNIWLAIFLWKEK
jgi:hypothetical protein